VCTDEERQLLGQEVGKINQWRPMCGIPGQHKDLRQINSFKNFVFHTGIGEKSSLIVYALALKS
jgi:hypothetical protein